MDYSARLRLRVEFVMRLALVLLLSLFLGLPAFAGDGPPEGAPQGPPPAPVVVADVVARPVQMGRTFVGTVEPSRRSVVGSEFGGLVTEFLVREGDRVEAGQPLARLRTDLLDLRIQSAHADVDVAKQKLAELENGSRPEEIAQAHARVEQMKADLELRKWKLEAAQTLRADNTISEDELRDARLAVRAAELLLAAAQSALDLVEAGPRKEQIAQARAALDRAQAQLGLLEDEKSRYVIKAPFAGWVVEEHTEIGQWLGVGAPVATIVALDEVDVTVEVVEDFVGALSLGLPVRVAIDAVPDRIFTGTIHKVVPSADRRGRTFPVKVRLPNERVGDGVLLKAGMYASATLAVGEKKPAILVPKDAVVLGGQGPVLVWAVGEGTVARRVLVQLGVAVDDLVEVKGEIQPGMRVIVRGNERIHFPGQPLKILEK